MAHSPTGGQSQMDNGDTNENDAPEKTEKTSGDTRGKDRKDKTELRQRKVENDADVKKLKGERGAKKDDEATDDIKGDGYVGERKEVKEKDIKREQKVKEAGKANGCEKGKENDEDKDKEKEDSEGEKTPTMFEKICYKMNINPNLVMLKITLFMMYGATASLLPYLTIHMQSIGLTVEEIAIVYLALPLTTFLSPPVTGFLVDKIGNYKPVVIFTLVLNAAFHHSLLLIPAMETPGVMPAAYVMRHPVTGKVDVWWSPCPSRECPEAEELDLVLDDCLDHCLLLEPEAKPKKKTLLQEIHQGIAVRPPTLLPEKEKPPPTKEEADKVMLGQKGPGGPNDGLNFTSKPSKKTKKSNSTSSILLPNATETTTKRPADTPRVYFMLDMHPDLEPPIEQLGIEMEQEENETVSDFSAHFSQKLMEDAGVNYTTLLEEDLRCGGAVLATNLTYKTLTELAADCMLQKCSFREGGPELCPPDFKESDDRIFWIYFLLRFVATIMLSAGVTMLDPIALTMIQRYGGQFGRERLFSSIGMAIFSPIIGLIIDQSSRNGVTDYSSAFYAYDVLLAVSCVTLALMPIGGGMPADNILQDLLRLLRMPHVICFIVFLFWLGNFWGFIESFLFLYLKELGAPNYLLGITVTVGTLSSIPFLYGADKITHKFGHVNVIVLAFFSHAARLMGYSFIERAWWCFPFEAIESLAVHLMWVAAATYCSILAPKTLLATLIGVLGMAHFSLGRGSGSFVGGLLIGTVGTRKAFRIMGLLACAGGALYGLLHLLWLKKYDKQMDKDLEEGEGDRLNGDGDADGDADDEEEGPITKMSLERLSLMIQFNMRGSVTSLDGLRGAAGGTSVSRPDLRSSRQSIERRGSAVENYRAGGRGSVSRTDLRKSALEINHLQATLRSSNPQLISRAPSIKVLTPQALRKNQRNLSVSALGLESRRDSIREEEEHDEPKQVQPDATGSEPMKT
ncbi:uncharacterized protein LOC113210370 isoform X1 [Frankliniella occidentalis]|uniref:Uncharacterized protein LOC113210370 isoform X1 n=1 Tax=Frankliniella occidentalis TaxID=133901 RepID=A0A6J1SS53_FRAOC|nr:uncharacterized protein LOC113210370 isoform X1 [Frankliniella occidentalis]